MSFIVKSGNCFTDIETGTEYDLVPEEMLPYDEADHGLCEELSVPVMKNLGFPHSIFLAKQPKKQFRFSKPIKVQFGEKYTKQQQWNFTPFETDEIQEGIREGLDTRKIAIRVCAPQEAVENVIAKIGSDREVVKRVVREKSKRTKRIRRTRK